jgi:hypothetical protein
MYQNNQNNQNNRKPYDDYYVKQGQYFNRMYAQERCPSIDSSGHQCILTKDHYGKHKSNQGHEWQA